VVYVDIWDRIISTPAARVGIAASGLAFTPLDQLRGMCLGAVAAFPLWLSANPVGGLVEGSATIFFGCFFLFSLGRVW
jgi:hypothetical protein